MDPGASHCYIDSNYARQLGLPLRHAGKMSIITAGTKHPTSERYQVWLDGKIRGEAGNYAAITGWFTLFDLKGAYDLIVGKNWHSTTRHMVDSDNVLHLLDEEHSADGRVAFVPRLALKGLRPQQGRYQEVHNHWKVVARAASINLISAEETSPAMAKSSKYKIFVLDVRERKVESSGKTNPCWQTWVSGESRSGGSLTTCSSHQRECHSQENTTSASIQTLQRKFRTASRTV